MWPVFYITLKSGDVYRISRQGIFKKTGTYEYTIQGTYTSPNTTARHVLTGDSYIVVGAGGHALPVGAAIGKTLHFEFANVSSVFDGADFYGAKINAYGTLTVPSSTGYGTVEESVSLGTYTVVTPTAVGQRIAINAVDEMYKADQEYSHTLGLSSGTVEARDVFINLCAKTGFSVTNAFTSLGDIGNYTLSTDKDAFKNPERYTFRKILGDLAGVRGKNVWFGFDNALHFIGYETPIASRSTDMALWLGQPTLDTDVIAVTGVAAKDGDGQTVLAGAQGYVLVLDNALLQGEESRLLTYASAALVGLRFTQFSGKYISWPILEPLDAIHITGPGIRLGAYSYITDFETHFVGGTSLSNSAEPVIKNQYGKYGNSDTGTLRLIEQESERVMSAYEQEMERINTLLAGAFGLYLTEEVQQDGSTIFSLHNRPTIDQSTIEYRADATIGIVVRNRETTSDAWSAVSAVTATGDAIFRILTAYGIRANWINAGTLQVLGSDGTVAFSVSFPEGSTDSRITIDGARTTIRALSGTEIDVTDSASEIAAAYTMPKSSKRRQKLFDLIATGTSEGLEFRKDSSSSSMGRMFFKASAGQIGCLVVGGPDYPAGIISLEDSATEANSGPREYAVLSHKQVAYTNRDEDIFRKTAPWYDILKAAWHDSSTQTTISTLRGELTALQGTVSALATRVDTLDTTDINSIGSVKHNLDMIWQEISQPV